MRDSSRKSKDEIVHEFIAWCGKVGYAKVEVEIMDGVPVRVLRPIQSVRFDLTENSGNSTMK